MRRKEKRWVCSDAVTPPCSPKKPLAAESCQRVTTTWETTTLRFRSFKILPADIARNLRVARYRLHLPLTNQFSPSFFRLFLDLRSQRSRARKSNSIQSIQYQLFLDFCGVSAGLDFTAPQAGFIAGTSRPPPIDRPQRFRRTFCFLAREA